LAGRVAEQDIVAALGQGEEQGQQKCHDDDPMGQVDPCGRSSGKQAEDKADRDAGDVDDGLVLKLVGVGDVQKYVGCYEAQDQRSGVCGERYPPSKKSANNTSDWVDVTLPEAMGRCCFSGCLRSSKRSCRSFRI
jgi:hypothetical protein